jgi:hypothetical protein
VADHPDRFARVVVANTGLPTGDQPMPEAFLAWQRYSQDTPDFAVGRIISGGCATPLAPEVVAACSSRPGRTTLPPIRTAPSGRCCRAGTSRS